MEPDRWLGIELRHLIALEAVTREGSFGRAATSLGYTQSAISQQIAMLDRRARASRADAPVRRVVAARRDPADRARGRRGAAFARRARRARPDLRGPAADGW